MSKLNMVLLVLLPHQNKHICHHHSSRSQVFFDNGTKLEYHCYIWNNLMNKNYSQKLQVSDKWHCFDTIHKMTQLTMTLCNVYTINPKLLTRQNCFRKLKHMSPFPLHTPHTKFYWPILKDNTVIAHTKFTNYFTFIWLWVQSSSSNECHDSTQPIV